jgi:hypothetical protein
MANASTTTSPRSVRINVPAQKQGLLSVVTIPVGVAVKWMPETS